MYPEIDLLLVTPELLATQRYVVAIITPFTYTSVCLVYYLYVSLFVLCSVVFVIDLASYFCSWLDSSSEQGVPRIRAHFTLLHLCSLARNISLLPLEYRTIYVNVNAFVNFL